MQTRERLDPSLGNLLWHQTYVAYLTAGESDKPACFAASQCYAKYARKSEMRDAAQARGEWKEVNGS